MQNHDIVVLGASAGGLETLKQLVKLLPAELPASIFVVLHIAPNSPMLIPHILAKAGPLPAQAAKDGSLFERGRIYVAPPDHHLLLQHDQMRVVHGPKENRHRPAVDPLFRSAAWAYGPRVVAGVLSGTLDDGASGLWAVKTCGGVTVVQDPADALHPGMPSHALQSVPVDHCLPLAEIGPLIAKLARTQLPEVVTPHVPDELKAETQFSLLERDITSMDALGKPSAFTCPECHGALWELQDGGLLRYRCHVGHAYAEDSLLADQSEAIEESLYTALRALVEKAATLRRIGGHAGAAQPAFQAQYEARAQALDEHAAVLRRLLGGEKLAESAPESAA